MAQVRFSNASIPERGNEVNKVLVKKQRERHKEELATSLPRLLDPISSVEYIVTKALQTSAYKIKLYDVNALISRIKGGDSVALNYYNYNIAKELGKVLGLWSKNIRAVYAYNYDDATSGADCFENTSMFSLIHMIIWAEQKNKPLNALVEAIDDAMAQRHKRMLGLSQLEHVLDIQIISDEDVVNRTGYAALLESIYQLTIEVWRCNPVV